MARRWMAVLALAACVLPAAAGAQEPDTLPLPADTVRLRTALVQGMGRCPAEDFQVVDDAATAARLREHPWCRDSGFGDLSARTLVGLRFAGSCHARFQADAWRVERSREYVVHATTHEGVCRAAGGGYFWIALPKLPPGWTIRFAEQRSWQSSTERDETTRSLDQLILPQPGDPVAGAEAMGPTAMDRGLRPDSAGIPADTVRLEAKRVRALEECEVVGHQVVKDEADTERMRGRWPQCRDADFGSLAERTLVGMPLFGDCHARFAISAWRSESRRELRVRVAERYGGCRAGRHHYVWLELPRLPEGWRVAFTNERVEKDEGDAYPWGLEIITVH